MTRRVHLDRRRLLALVEDAYAAAENASLWDGLLVSLADAIAASGATLISHDLASSGSAAHPARMDPEAIRQYQDYYHQHDVWAHAAGHHKLPSPGRVLTDRAIVPRAALERTEYYPFVKRYGITRLLHATLGVRGGVVCGVSLYRSDADREFGGAEVRFVEALAPHLQRALRMTDMFARATLDRQVALDALDAARQAVLFVTAEGRVVFANRTANRILGGRDGLSMARLRTRAGIRRPPCSGTANRFSRRRERAVALRWSASSRRPWRPSTTRRERTGTNCAVISRGA